MDRVSRDEPLSKAEFHQRLREWFDNTEHKVIGPVDINYPRTGWVHVRDGSDLLFLNADTPRDAVGLYLQLVKRYGDDMQWERAVSQQGKMSAVVYGPEKLRCKPFYLYYASPLSGADI